MSKPISTTERRKSFERLVHEAEILIASHPKVYRYKVAGLALLGYLVLFGLVILLVGLLAGCIGLIIISHSAILFLLKSKLIIALPMLIWVSFPIFAAPMPLSEILTDGRPSSSLLEEESTIWSPVIIMRLSSKIGLPFFS